MVSVRRSIHVERLIIIFPFVFVLIYFGGWLGCLISQFLCLSPNNSNFQYIEIKFLVSMTEIAGVLIYCLILIFACKFLAGLF